MSFSTSQNWEIFLKKLGKTSGEPIFDQFLVLGLEDGGGNATEVDIVPDLSKCGVNYCPAVDNPDVNNTEIDPEEDNFSATSYQLYILAGVYLACSILSAVVLALFVDPLSK